MIHVDISNIWERLSLPDLLAMEPEVSLAHATLTEQSGQGKEFLGWMQLPTVDETEELRRIRETAQRLRDCSEAVVVVGIGGSYLGPRAAIELLRGSQYNLCRGKKGNPQIFFAGNTLSTRAWNELTEILEERDFSLILISKSGTTTESAIAARGLRWLLERKYGTDEARGRVVAITDPEKGALRAMAQKEGWDCFAIPPDVGGRFSVLSPVGLLPMAVAGLDLEGMMLGASMAREEYNLRSFENPAWLYAAVRNLLYRHGKSVELLAAFEPCCRAFGGWWQQLFGESEGKDGKGLFPVYAEFTADLHSLGQMIQQGQRNLFETMLRFAPPEQACIIVPDWENLDGLNYLQGKALDEVDEKAFRGTLAAHADGGVPVITMEAGPVNEETLGELFWFFQLSCGISAYILGVNPFNQPGVEFYKRNMFRLLGKPGFEA